MDDGLRDVGGVGDEEPMVGVVGWVGADFEGTRSEAPEVVVRVGQTLCRGPDDVAGLDDGDVRGRCTGGKLLDEELGDEFGLGVAV